MATPSRLYFRRYGTSYHVVIDDAAGLAQAIALDEAHWGATTAPIHAINADKVFLSLLDEDVNGRITCDDIRKAVRWLLEILSDTAGIDEQSEILCLGHLNAESRDGTLVRQAAKKILARLGRPGDGCLTLADIRRIKAQEESRSVSEAGVVLPEAAGDDDVRRFVANAIRATGGAPHPAGSNGLTAPLLDRFLAEVRACLDWRRRGELPPGAERSELLPLGERTADAYTAYTEVRSKIDQYFAQCEAAALDERLLQRIGFSEADLLTLDFGDAAVIEDTLRRAPLTRPRPEMVLHFDDPINPHYIHRLDRLRQQAITPLLGDIGPALTTRHWHTLATVLAPYRAWIEAPGGVAAAFLDSDTLTGYLDERFGREVRAMIDLSRQTAIALDGVRLAEKAALFQSKLLTLANNFISFPYLYSSAHRAMFEMGTLVMDGRRYEMAVRVDDRKEHARLAQSSNIYVLYVEVTPDDPAGKYEVAIPVTSGGKGNLTIGKRGVFFDLKGRELDARVVDLIENPIGLAEAVASPFVRLGRLITGKIESITTEAEKKLDSQATASLNQVAPATGQPAAPAPQGMSSGGLLLGGGVAVAALGSAFAYIATTLAAIAWWKIVLGVLIAALAVAVPTTLVAYIRLRGRDLSALLEGSGWGVNARMRLSFSQGRFFTRRPPYPKGSRGTRVHWWWRIAIIAIVTLALSGGGFLLQRAVRDRNVGTADIEQNLEQHGADGGEGFLD